MYSVCSLLLAVFQNFHRWTVPLSNSFCQLSLSQFYANLGEDYVGWVVQFALFVKLQLLTCKGSLGHVAFHSIILFENLAIPWLVARLAYVNNVDNVMRNYVCSRKWNFHVRISVNTVACHAVTVCKYANLQVVTHNNFMENCICNKKRLFHEHLSY